eukprot:TRINITY_DN1185_c0_g1_i1.p1 TRINITY_DN1185_c0_g1~~TRINITY_DN1185_c0_g1_i1.p1  ORF type:complete len:1635 (-),score=388.23 TRINITY_DN1185_c0_g1_i1:75-4979(-)
MRRVIIVALLFCSVLYCISGQGTVSCPGQATPNYIQNGDFEGGLSGWSANNARTQGSGEQNAYNGQASLRMNANGAGPSSVEQTFNVDASVRRIIHLHLSVSPVKGFTGNAPILVTIFNSAGTNIGSRQITVQGSAPNWRMETVGFVNARGAPTYRLRIETLTPSSPGPAIDGVFTCIGDIQPDPPVAPPPPPASRAPPILAPSKSSAPSASAAASKPAAPALGVYGQDPALSVASSYKNGSRTGIAATGSYTDPDGVVHNYYVYERADGITAGGCYATPPQVVRDAVPADHYLVLSSVVSDAERVAVGNIIKGMKAPYTFDKLKAYVVDNVYDVNTNQWVSIYGKCKPNNYIPWGDYASCCEDKEPNTMSGAYVEFCSAMDFRADLVCTVGGACTTQHTNRNCTPPVVRDRKCFYDGVYNNFYCTARYTGCIYESVKAPLPTKTFGCRTAPHTCSDNTLSLMRNADFEVGQYFAGKNRYEFTPGSTGLFGWTITGGAIHSQTGTFPATSGKFALVLNPTGSGSVFQQWVQLDGTQRRNYILTFTASSQPNTAASPIRVTILNAANQVLRTTTFTIPTTATVTYQTYSFTFNTAVGRRFYTIQFRTTTNQPGAIFDTVKLCPGNVLPPDAPIINAICDIPPTTITLNPGWDIFPPATPAPNVTYSLRGTTFTASMFIPGETQARRLGMHFKYPANAVAACKAGPTGKFASFGNLLLSQPSCQPGTRQGVTNIGSYLDLAKADTFVTRPMTVNGVAGHGVTLTATNIQEGEWPFQFSVRSSSTDLGVMWQSKKYGDTIVLKVCPVQTRCAIGSQILTNNNFDQGAAVRAFSGPTLSNVGANQGQYDLLNANVPSPITGWKINSGTVLWRSHSITLQNRNFVSVGLLPGASISQNFVVPTDYAGYTLSFYAAPNPWNSPATLTAQIFYQLTVSIVNTATGGMTTPSRTYRITPGASSFRLTFPWIAGEDPFRGAGSKNYTLTFTLAGALPAAGVVTPATYNYGIILGLPSMCLAPTPAVAGSNNYCFGQEQYLSNNMFTPTATTAGEASHFVSIRPGTTRISPWTVAVGEVDHIWKYWQQPPGAQYSIDLSGSTTGMYKATIQQTFKLPAAAARYTLKYAFTGNPECNPQTKSMRLQITTAAGQSIIDSTVTTTISGKSKTNMGWVERVTPFSSIAGTADYIVKFSSLDDTACGPVVGNAYICAEDPNAPTPPLRPLVCNAGKTANAVANGDFEVLAFKNNLPWSLLYPGSVGLTNWNVFSGTIEVVTDKLWPAASGKNSLDLTGQFAPGTIRQALNLPGGYPWTLSFAMAGNPGTPPQTKAMQVTIYRGTTRMTPLITRNYTWTTTAADTLRSMNWKTQTMDFSTSSDVSEYLLEFKSLTDGVNGIALDAVSICSPQVMTYPPTTPFTSNTEPTTWTVTADNSYELYVDGVEIPPANAAAISRDGGCKGKRMSSDQGKYCCENDAASGASPRCDWTKSERFDFPIKSSGSVVAIHVVNFHHGGDPKAGDSTTGGANPAALLVSYLNNGRQCGVSDTNDWLCTFSLTAAEQSSMSWTKYDYDESRWKSPVGYGINGPNAWAGAPGANLFKGNSVWFSGAGTIANVPTYAQWIWGDRGAAGAFPEMWCRTRVPNLYC